MRRCAPAGCRRTADIVRPRLPGVPVPGVGDPPDDADSEGVGLGCSVGRSVGRGVEAATDGSLDATAEAGCAGDAGGVGPAHVLDGNV